MKKNIFKKIGAGLLVTSISLSFTACGDKTASNEENPTLKWMLPGGDGMTDVASVNTEISKITNDKFGFNVELNFISTGAYNERMRMYMASGAEWDLCFTGWVNPYKTAVNNGSYAPLSKLLDEYGKETKEIIGEEFLRDAYVGDEIYAIPNYQVSFVQHAVWVQKNLADKYNFDLTKVTNLNELEPFLKLIKDNEPDIFPWRSDWGVGLFYNDKYEEITSKIVIDTSKENAQPIFLRDTPEFKNGVETFRDWYEKGYIRKDVASVGDDSADLNNGRYAVFASNWKPGAEETFKIRFGIEYVPIKLGAAYIPNGATRSAMTAINKDSKYQKESMQLINLVNTNTELMDLITFGIEGKHYTRDENGKVSLIKDSGYGASGSSWNYGNQFIASLEVGMADDVYKETQRLNSEAKKSDIFGFNFDQSPVVNEISQVGAIIQEYDCLNNGSRDPEEYFSEMEQRLKTAGEDKIFEEVKKQLDDFYKNKE